jgi:hypothetical protein
MKNFLLILFFLFFTKFHVQAQFGVNYHQSGLSFLGVTYEFEESFLAEARFSTDVFLDDLAVEGVIAYKIHKGDNHFAYVGVGGRYAFFPAFVVPVGLAIFPFENKQFGFHIEAAPLIQRFTIFRGSWGIRYRFR